MSVGTAVPGPVPVGPAVERVGEPADLGLVGRVVIEVGGGDQCPREQERRVDRGQLALPHPAAGLDVEEVVEEALVPGGVRFRPLRKVVQEAEPPAGDLGRERPEEHARVDDDREGRQGHPHGGDAARGGRIGLVPDQPVIRVGLMQVIEQRGPLEPAQVVVDIRSVFIFRAISFLYQGSPLAATLYKLDETKAVSNSPGNRVL